MAALTADRKSKERSLERAFSALLAANAIPFQMGLVSVSATGFAAPSTITAGTRVIGWASAKVDNTGGADGALSVPVQTGCLLLDNDAGVPVVQADVGRPCYVKDDHTVQGLAGTSTVIAGRVEAIDASGGIWVKVGAELGVMGGADIAAAVDASAGAAVPVVHTFDLVDAASGNRDLVIKEAFEITDVTVIKNGAGAANTVQVQTGAGVAISDAIAAAVDKTVTRAGTIDRASNLIAAGGTLRLAVVRAAGSAAMKVIVFGVKR